MERDEQINIINTRRRTYERISLVAAIFSIISVILTSLTLFREGNQYSFFPAIIAAIAGSILSISFLRLKQKSTVYNPSVGKKIFLSYVREDRDKVLVIYQQLKEMGLNPWMDIEDLKPGELWQDKIMEAIKASDVTLLCFSKNSINKKGFITKEIEYSLMAFNGNDKQSPLLIPVKLDDAEIPSSFAMFQYSDLTQKDGWDKLKYTLVSRFNISRS